MREYVNLISFGNVSVNVKDPFDVTLESLAVSNTELVSAMRYDYPDAEDDAGVDVSAFVTVSGQIVTVADIWAVSETSKSTGVKRLCVVARNTNASAVDEVNILFNVV